MNSLQTPPITRVKCLRKGVDDVYRFKELQYVSGTKLYFSCGGLTSFLKQLVCFTDHFARNENELLNRYNYCLLKKLQCYLIQMTILVFWSIKLNSDGDAKGLG